MNNGTKMAVDWSVPSHVKGKYDSFLLLKFFEEETYRDYFLSGKLYMRQHAAFTNEELGKGRSDCTEGSDFAVLPLYTNTYPDIRCRTIKGELYVEVTEYPERPDDYRENQLFIKHPKQSEYRNIFSMYTLWYNTSRGLICKIDADNMKSFGEYGVLIVDTDTFLNRVALAASREHTIRQMSCGFVHYIEGKNVMNLDPFKKRAEGFLYQNEFRFCAETDNTDLLELDTHTSFQDIAIPIRLKEFADTVSFKDGNLNFKADVSNEG